MLQKRFVKLTFQLMHQFIFKYGLVSDFVRYSPSDGWAPEAFSSDSYLSLTNLYSDNHLPENWKTISVKTGISNTSDQKNIKLSVYPNPAIEWLNISGDFEENALIEILTLSGQQMMALRSDSKGHSAVHISGLKPGIYIVRVNSDTSKLVIGK